MSTNKKSKDNTTKSEPVKLQPRNVNKSVKNVFELKKEKPSKREQWGNCISYRFHQYFYLHFLVQA